MMESEASQILAEYSFPIWLRIVPFGVAASLTGLAMFLFQQRKWGRIPWIVLMVGLTIGCLIAPAIALDRIAITPSSLQYTTGFWFAPAQKEIVFTNVIFIERTTVNGLKGRKHNAWNVYHWNGDVSQVEHGDLWRLHADDIDQRVQSLGVGIK